MKLDDTKSTAPIEEPVVTTETIAEEFNREVDPLDTKEVQIAAGQYAQYCREIRGRAKNMKAGGLGRVLIAFTEFPYSEKLPKFRDRSENELFLLMMSNAKAKGVIALALQGQQQDLENRAAHMVADELLDSAALAAKGEEDGVDKSRNDKGNEEGRQSDQA